MNVLVCVKRVPATGAKIVLTEDEQAIETRNLGFTISPHEECAVEEAVRLVEQHGGHSTVLTLGPDAATEQLRDALAVGIDHAILLETDGSEWDPIATARAIVEAIRAQHDAGLDPSTSSGQAPSTSSGQAPSTSSGHRFDVLLFGNEAADTGDYQVGIRVAHALDLPCVTGIKALEIRNGTAMARREATGGWEVFEVTLPAVFTVKEGINLPRYPSLPGRLRAKKKEIEQHPHPRPEAPTPRGHPTQGVPARPRESPRPPWNGGGLEKVRLKIPREEHSGAEILGEGPATAPKIVEILKELGLV